jgi:hypothetical protein
VMFNPDTDRAEDVSHAVAQEILRRHRGCTASGPRWLSATPAGDASVKTIIRG